MQTDMRLAEMLVERAKAVRASLACTDEHWQAMIDLLSRGAAYREESLWTFLLACAYAAAGEHGVAALTKALTDAELPNPPRPRIWLEAQPLAPRHGEANTHVDLALGCIEHRRGTKQGVQLADVPDPWVCFCEAKWYSDISPQVTGHVRRNQLARLIENAVCFQRHVPDELERYADHVFVALITPSIFWESTEHSRLYQYKYDEYAVPDRAVLLENLGSCALEPRKGPNWVYPLDLAQRVQRAALHWETFEELFGTLPHSELAGPLCDFWGAYGLTQLGEGG